MHQQAPKEIVDAKSTKSHTHTDIAACCPSCSEARTTEFGSHPRHGSNSCGFEPRPAQYGCGAVVLVRFGFPICYVLCFFWIWIAIVARDRWSRAHVFRAVFVLVEVLGCELFVQLWILVQLFDRISAPGLRGFSVSRPRLGVSQTQVSASQPTEGSARFSRTSSSSSDGLRSSAAAVAVAGLRAVGASWHGFPEFFMDEVTMFSAARP